MIINESLDNVIGRPEVIISDWDGVVQFIDRAWLAGLASRPELFSQHFDLERLTFKEKGFIDKIVGRDKYYIDQWLCKDPAAPIPDEVRAAFMSVYLDDPEFYAGCNFLGMSESLIAMSKQSFCKEIIFLSHVPTADGRDERKQRIFDARFAPESDKFRLVTIPHDMPKWKWIAENRPNYTCFIDDRFDIIRDVVMNTDSNKKTFLMPYLGYNKHFVDDHEFIQLVEFKGSQFSTYYNTYLSE